MACLNNVFTPWVGENPKVLILGVLPDDISIAKQAYYQNKARDSFYKIMHSLFPNEENVPDKEFIISHHIALWNMMMVDSHLKESTDNGINNAQPNDICKFLEEHNSIRTIIINGQGKRIELLFKTYFASLEKDYKIVFLPQTANINFIKFSDKVSAWSVVKSIVEPSTKSPSDSVMSRRQKRRRRDRQDTQLSIGCMITGAVFIVAFALYSYQISEPQDSEKQTPVCFTDSVTESVDTPKVMRQHDRVMRQKKDFLYDEYYDEGYEKGYADGQEDCNDGDYQSGYDDSNKYSGEKAASYYDGYHDGYEDAFDEVTELSEDGCDDLDEALKDDK